MELHKNIKIRLEHNNNFSSFWANIFNLRGHLYEYDFSDDPLKADAEAIAGDWVNVGKDMRRAIDKYNNELEDTDGKTKPKLKQSATTY